MNQFSGALGDGAVNGAGLKTETLPSRLDHRAHGAQVLWNKSEWSIFSHAPD
jgi:hypothetical protein